MSNGTTKKAVQISVDDMAAVAATGVARALEARKAAGVALNAEELSQVNGGATLSAMLSATPWIIKGGKIGPQDMNMAGQLAY